MGFAFGQDEDLRRDAASQQSNQCEAGHVVEIFNYLEHREVCGSCHETHEQMAMEPCCSQSCCGDDEAIFHASCMVQVGTDVFQGHLCRQAGVPT